MLRVIQSFYLRTDGANAWVRVGMLTPTLHLWTINFQNIWSGRLFDLEKYSPGSILGC